MDKYSISYGKSKIDFNLTYKIRKNLRISVHPDLSVSVFAPLDKSLDDILIKVRKRAAWIRKQQDFYMQFKPSLKPKNFVSGETHRYLGRQYRLKVYQSTAEEIKLKGKYFEVCTSDRKNSDRIKKLLYKWYRQHSEVKFNRIIDDSVLKLQKYGIDKPDVSIRKMISRWGSCQQDKRKITLNLELIKAPSHCIEYVIVHELVHLKYPNHNQQFYNFLSLVMPDWKLRKRRLELVKISP